jgi:hypothetical protein
LAAKDVSVMKTKNYNPSDSALNKKYFVNLLTTRKEKFITFNEAVREEPVLAAIAENLKTNELQLLIDRIENKP